MTTSAVNTTVSGKDVTITANIDSNDASRGWWVRVTSRFDYGYGKGQGVGDYPWIVDIIGPMNTIYYNSAHTYKPGLYIAELNVMGIGPVDYSTFELTEPKGTDWGKVALLGVGVFAAISLFKSSKK